MESQVVVVMLQTKNTSYLSACLSSIFLSYNLKLWILIKNDNTLFSLAYVAIFFEMDKPSFSKTMIKCKDV